MALMAILYWKSGQQVSLEKVMLDMIQYVMHCGSSAPKFPKG